MTKVVHDTDLGAGLEVAGGKVNVAASQATDAEVAAAITAQDAAENAAEATAKLRSEFCRRAQQVLSTSAVIECAVQGIKFKPDLGATSAIARIIVMGAGQGSHACASGYLDFDPPAVGTTIYGMGVPDKVVDPNGFIPVTVTHQTLWYKLPPAGANFSTQGTWHYSVYGAAGYNVPDDYIFIAQGQPNIAGGVYILYDGRHLVMGDNYTDTSWQLLSSYYTAGSTDYLHGGTQIPRFRRSGNRVYLEGLIKNANLVTGGTVVVATLPAGFRPPTVHIFASPNDLQARRVDVRPDGTVLQLVSPAGSIDRLSLDGISFDLA